MSNYLMMLMAVLFSTLYLMADASMLHGDSPKFHVENKEIHLKHGKLHPHHHAKKDEDDDEDHLIYRYRWLGDDIVKNEDEFEGEMDDEYSDKGSKIKLPGGCELTETQYIELESFKKRNEIYKRMDQSRSNLTVIVKNKLHQHQQQLLGEGVRLGRGGKYPRNGPGQIS